ncbi:unnamed protein product [Adineta ricciae]|uniref:protein-tyrosine-phosphatase n=1 Tax=Adineta ricciae TaxID=249248 RepID=A0A816EI54_ADIRI|nr:unnamed protein product [Adineta ricciae]CAF1650004.1 unnamed protein product [Adineta ricciae]
MAASQNKREQYLRENCNATEAELAYIQSIVQLKQPYFGRAIPSSSRPSEILDSWLYHGNWQQANNSTLLDSLSITHIVNATDKTLVDQLREIHHISSKNGRLAELSPFFQSTNEFLDKCHEQGCRVLVHCERGVSRSSTIVLAYLMHHKRWTVAQAFEYLLTRRQQASPNHVLLLQLVRYENELNKTHSE